MTEFNITTLTNCRICGGTDFEQILNLGDLALTGHFPAAEEEILKAPLELVKCTDKSGCGLVQLKHMCDLSVLYGDNYGYRSGLNNSMTGHLKNINEYLINLVSLQKGDIVFDIGSNDGSYLGFYPEGIIKYGIDPTANKFASYYAKDINIIPRFFDDQLYKHMPNDLLGKVRIITSIAMFYDLPNPIKFAKTIKEYLSNDGVWFLELSYLPTMMDQCSYDTICHEHLEYYCLKQLIWIMNEAGLYINDIKYNHVNGGSVQVLISKTKLSDSSIVNNELEKESNLLLNELTPYQGFRDRVMNHRQEVIQFLQECRIKNQKVFGYGASTKGNVLLQYCNITQKLISGIAEVNQDKFNKVTPGSNIPIYPEDKIRKKSPEYFFVLCISRAVYVYRYSRAVYVYRYSRAVYVYRYSRAVYVYRYSRAVY